MSRRKWQWVSENDGGQLTQPAPTHPSTQSNQPLTSLLGIQMAPKLPFCAGLAQGTGETQGQDREDTSLALQGLSSHVEPERMSVGSGIAWSKLDLSSGSTPFTTSLPQLPHL